MERADTVVTFSVAESLFAVEVAIVQEIISPQVPTRLPNAPPHLLGLIDVRGTSVALVDLRRILAEDTQQEDEETRILLLQIPTGGETHRVALRVDRVIEVANLDDDGRIRPLSEAEILDWDPRVVHGIGRRNGVITTLLDIGAIFDPAVLSAHRQTAPRRDGAPCPG